MSELKIRVNNEAESKEVQELFFKLGASHGNGDHHAVMVSEAIGLAVIDGLINFVFNEIVFFDIKQCKEITLPELRAMVKPSINDQYAKIEEVRQHSHYFKDVSSLNEIDVYMVLKLFNVTDPCLQHIAKKALCAGQRGHKDFKKDLQDILDTAKRAVEINNDA